MGLRALASKQHILDCAGFVYNFDRRIYFSRPMKKAFSVEFIQDHGEDELERRIHAKPSGEGRQFYFNSEPPPEVRRQLEALLDSE